MGGQLLASPRAARMACAVALLAGAAVATVPTVIGLSKPVEEPDVVLSVSPQSKVILESHDDRVGAIMYDVTTRFTRRSIGRGTLTIAADQRVIVPMPPVSCPTPVTVQIEQLVPYRSRSVSLTILQGPGGEIRCGR